MKNGRLNHDFADNAWPFILLTTENRFAVPPMRMGPIDIPYKDL
jgi:hypothetical protein